MVNYFRILLLINFLLVVFGLIVYSDTTLEEIQAVGCYSQDKSILRSTSKGIYDYEHLKLYNNNTFQLFNNDTLYLSGTWKVVNKQPDNENIEFRFADKVINVDFDGYIFDVNYSNDFYSGKYERILFVRNQCD